MTKEFKYVVAKPWRDDEPDNLCIYTYMGSIRTGTMKSAKEFLEYVKSRVGSPDTYSIYKVKFKKVE